jgi:hypothetical protein
MKMLSEDVNNYTPLGLQCYNLVKNKNILIAERSLSTYKSLNIFVPFILKHAGYLLDDE